MNLLGLPAGLAPTWKRVSVDQNRAVKHGETSKVRWEALRWCVGTGLDLGCGPWKIHQNALGVDRNAGPFQGQPCQANIIRDVGKLEIFASESMDYVFSSHCLEDFEDWQRVLREWWRLVKPGGVLVLYLPMKGLYPPPGTPLDQGGNEGHKHEIGPEDIAREMGRMRAGWDFLVNQVRDQQDEYSFFQVWRKRGDRKQNFALEDRPEKTCAVIRYGGIGDHIMTASVLPQLKREGWHVVYVTNKAGQEVVRHDSHIDEIWTDTAALTPDQLQEYWTWIRTQFPRTLNMMNAIENLCLPQPNQGNYHLSESARRAMFGGINYIDAHHLQGEVEMAAPEARWYASPAEVKWAEKERRKLHEPALVVAWSLAGSAVHKVSPYSPQAVSLFLDARPEAVVVTLGGPKEKLLYEDFPEHPRHVRKAGEWGIRESLAFAKHAADVVVGPETGTLNAVGLEDTPKVVWLSHSNAVNLCGYWRNVVAVAPDPEVAPCHPCHRLHWSWDHCHRGERAALCVEGIPPERMAEAVGEAVSIVREEAAA